MTVRAKLRCSSESTVRYGFKVSPEDTPRKYEFTAVYDQTVAEDQRYARATPMASLIMQVDNPAVVFEPGKAYYLDISEAE